MGVAFWWFFQGIREMINTLILACVTAALTPVNSNWLQNSFAYDESTHDKSMDNFEFSGEGKNPWEFDESEGMDSEEDEQEMSENSIDSKEDEQEMPENSEKSSANEVGVNKPVEPIESLIKSPPVKPLVPLEEINVSTSSERSSPRPLTLPKPIDSTKYDGDTSIKLSTICRATLIKCWEMGGVCRRAAHKNVEVLGRCDTGKLLGASVIRPVVSCGICMGCQRVSLCQRVGGTCSRLNLRNQGYYYVPVSCGVTNGCKCWVNNCKGSSESDCVLEISKRLKKLKQIMHKRRLNMKYKKKN